MSNLLVLIILLALIFVSSTRVEYYTISILMKLTHSRTLAVSLFSILFLPGTIVHEFCHMIMAQLLGVRTTGIELFPRMEHDRVVMGEIGVEKTDPLRRIFIGAAPFLLGFPLVLLCIYTISVTQLVWWQILVMIFIIFQIANASFSSSKDMEGSAILILIFVAVLVVLYLSGLPILEMLAPIAGIGQLEYINKLLVLPLGINIFVWLLGRILLR